MRIFWANMAKDLSLQWRIVGQTTPSLRDFATQNRGNPNQESLIKKKNK